MCSVNSYPVTKQIDMYSLNIGLSVFLCIDNYTKGLHISSKWLSITNPIGVEEET